MPKGKTRVAVGGVKATRGGKLMKWGNEVEVCRLSSAGALARSRRLAHRPNTVTHQKSTMMADLQRHRLQMGQATKGQAKRDTEPTLGDSGESGGGLHGTAWPSL